MLIKMRNVGMKMLKINVNVILLFIFVISCLQFVDAAHYIAGYIEDALDGESANGKIVTLWNPENGVSDNLTDVVGPIGNSGTSNTFFIDCELLDSPCQAGDVMSAKIFEGDYITRGVNVTVSLSGYDAMDSLSLNSPPYPDLILPESNGNYPADINFNCSYFDYDDNVERVGLWGNWLGDWQEISFQNLGPESGYAIFPRTLLQGSYVWNCLVKDNFGIEKFSSSNNSFFVDTTPPVVYSVTPNQGNVCGFGEIGISCFAYDNELYIANVTIQSNSPNGTLYNYSCSHVTDAEWNTSVLVNEVGNWTFTCFVSDPVGNSDFLESNDLLVESGRPELYIVSNILSFSDLSPVEGKQVNASVYVGNSGCVESGDFNVSFFIGEFSGGEHLSNITISIPDHSTQYVTTPFIIDIGLSNIFSYLDLDDIISEDNESNNYVNNTLYLRSWQKIFGNLTLDKILMGEFSNLSFWSDEKNFGGNIFVADKDSEVNWLSLQAVGRTKSGLVSSNDFSEIDSFLGTNVYNDSVYAMFTNFGTPKGIADFYVFQNHIPNVPYFYSSSQENFMTGVLWDTSDSVDNEYDIVEGEDIVFATQINQESFGQYGIYDYEIDIPSKLRSYGNDDESEVYLYYDLN